MKANKTLVSLAMAAMLPGSLVSGQASAAILNFDWQGMFTALDTQGAPFANTSIPAKGNNQYQTPVTGTLQFDTIAGTGTATLTAFEFCSNQSGLPFQVTSMTLESIGDGAGGAGTLLLGNLLYNWNGNENTPVSLVWDAAGLFAAIDNGLTPNQSITGVGAVPASDGTYVGSAVPGAVDGPYGYPGYLGLGPTPLATTAWNTTSLCSRGGVSSDGQCLGLMPSGGLPLVLDTFANENDFLANDGAQAGTHGPYGDAVYGIGGSPMIDGVFPGMHFNFDMTSLTVTSTEVPIPGAIWLLGSGLLALVGAARRRQGG